MRQLVGIAMALGMAAACSSQDTTHPAAEPRPPVVPLGELPVYLEPDRPLRCLLDLDCLMHEADVAAGRQPVVP